ncbi:hypothetical protein D3C87_583780 [compost metagenome]
MNITGLTSEDKAKLKHVVNEGLKVTQEVEDLKGALNDTVKAVAEELGIKPSAINKAIRAAFKANIADTREELDNVEEILNVVGKL